MKIVIRPFCVSSGIIFFITGMAKLLSAYGKAKILNYTDPILGIQFGHLLFAAGIIELAVAAICLMSKSHFAQTAVTAWLASSLLTYRLGLFWIGWHRPCPCLGNLTDSLHIPPQTADTAMKIILAYLLLGSYGTLFWLWRQRRKAVPVSLQH